MSFKAMAYATEQTITQTAPQSHLLLILASYANDNNECYPSIKTMMAKTRLSEKTVRKCLKELSDFGLIIDTGKVSAFGAKVYQINFKADKNTVQNCTHIEQTPSNFTTPTPSKITPPVNLPPLVNLPVPP